MENRQTGLIRFSIKLLVTTGLVLTLVACQTVQMPDLSSLNLGLSNQDTFVTIKPRYKSVNIRPTPSTNQTPVGTLKGGDEVKMTAERNNWFNIIYYDTAGTEQAGWIYKYLVVGYDKPVSSKEPVQPHESNQSEVDSLQPNAEEAPIEDISIL